MGRPSYSGVRMSHGSVPKATRAIHWPSHLQACPPPFLTGAPHVARKTEIPSATPVTYADHLEVIRCNDTSKVFVRGLAAYYCFSSVKRHREHDAMEEAELHKRRASPSPSTGVEEPKRYMLQPGFLSACTLFLILFEPVGAQEVCGTFCFIASDASVQDLARLLAPAANMAASTTSCQKTTFGCNPPPPTPSSLPAARNLAT